MQEIENKFGASQYLKKSTNGHIKLPSQPLMKGYSSSSTSQKAIPLSIIKRSKPVPPVGYYDNVCEAYIRTTQPKATGIKSLSSDKLPKFAFKPKELNPEPTENLNEFEHKLQYFRWNQARTGQNTHDFSVVPNRAKTHFLRKQNDL